MTERPVVIVNPRSGRGLDEQKWASMNSLIRKYLGPFDSEFTKATGDGIRIAEEQAKNGRQWIIAMGGDGTMSEAATGIIRSGETVALSLLPRGTGGDLRRSLDMPANLEKALQHLRDASLRSMDAGKLSYIDHEGKDAVRFFVNTASFGASGKVAGRANQSSKVFGGKLSFAVATLRTTFTYDNPEIHLSLDGGEPARMRIVTVCVANGRFIGGGMKIAPDAKLNDGMFDVVAIGDFKVPEILMRSYKLYLGTHLDLDKVGVKRASKVHASAVNPDEEVLLEVDGETPGRLPATFEMLPSALRIKS